MTKYRKKPVVIEATPWFTNGDHPEDGKPEDEGLIVRRYRHPYVSSIRMCETCGHKMERHGWIDTLESGHVVCIGDWIITGVQNEHYPVKPDIFEATYEAV